MIVSYCKAKGINMTDVMKPEYMNLVMDKYGFRDWESILAAIGHGGLKEGQIINRMLEAYEADHAKPLTNEEVIRQVEENQAHRNVRMRPKSGITVRGIHDVAVRFSKCCSPLPGDEIVGFVTRGRGVSIHRSDCINMLSLPEIERSRIIEAEWEKTETENELYSAEIKIYANNRNGLLADISKALTEKDINIVSMNTRTNKQGMATLNTCIEIRSMDELNRIIEKIRSIESVVDIERTRS